MRETPEPWLLADVAALTGMLPERAAQALDVLRGNHHAAERQLREAIDPLRQRGRTAPFKAGAGLQRGELLTDVGRPDEALAVLAEEEQAAERAGTPGALGTIRRLNARAPGARRSAASTPSRRPGVASPRSPSRG